MAWFSRIFTGQEGRNSVLAARQQQLLAAWRELPEADLSRSHYRSRYVLVDIETTTVDPHGDRLSAIAALTLVDGLIDFKDSLHVVVAHDEPSVTAGSQNCPRSPPVAGVPLAEALLSLLDFAGKAPLVVYHSSLVGALLERALLASLGTALTQPCIDLAWVLSDLFREVSDTPWSLDSWLDHFKIESIQRQNAVSDAYASAKLLQIAIARAARKGFDTPASLLELEKARRHLHQSG